MLICCDCDLVFEEPAISVEKHGLDSPPYERFEVCPACGSTDIHETFPCECCGEWIRGDYIEAMGMRICDDCCIHRNVEDD